MWKIIKQTFYTSLLIGVVLSFCLRCASPHPTVQQSGVDEDVKTSLQDPAVPSNGEVKRIAMTRQDPASGLRPGSNRADFAARTEDILKELPTLQSIRSNAKEDHHDTPASIVASGKLMGEVFDKMKANPEYLSTGLAFYSKCAGDRDIVVQVKALCLRNLRDWEVKAGMKMSGRFPKDVEKLAGQLPKTRFD